ncbi:MAG TPA: hypothetical protein PKC91_14730 [Ignavibacteria bacterium]|nr:hypothetical protein [Ignavibacteria bacterium]
MKILYLIFILCISFPVTSEAQSVNGLGLGSGYSILPSVIYVSSATIQVNAFSKNLYERGETEELDGGYGYGISIRKKIFNENISIGFTTEYLKIYDDELTEIFSTETSRIRARVTEELWMMPVELSGYFSIPKFSEDLDIYLGGGVGLYFGDRQRTVLNITSRTISKEPNFSFVILSGMELFFSKQFSGVFEMRFRQGEYTVKSVFPVSSITANGNTYPLEQNLNSKIFVDGLKLSLGLAYNF